MRHQLIIRRILGLGLSAFVFTFSPLSHAEFTIKQVTAQNTEQRLTVSADMHLSLTAEAQAAVENGVPLVVLTEFAVLRPGTFWDETLFKRKLRGRLRYHALSDRYIVERPDKSGIEIYRTVENALRHLGRVRKIDFDNIGVIPKDCLLAVRSRLDINALPAPLRPMALFSAKWHLSSDWTRWKIDH